MKRGKLLGLVLSLVLIASLVLPTMAYAAGPDHPGKPDKQKPVPATNVELVKKVTTRMPGPPIVPPGQDKKKKKEGVATGILGDPVSGGKYAVVVGISDYPDTANDLNYCDDDAEDMYLALTTFYGFKTKNVVPLIDKEGTEASGGMLLATRYNILGAIESIGKVVTSDDEVVFFFSGHGMKGIADDGDKEKIDEAIVAHDGTNIVPIWDGELKAAFSEFATSRIIFIFDICLAGGMKKDLEAPGRVIATATTERGSAYESDTWQNGEFTYYFVDQGMIEGKANIHDYDGDTLLYEPTQVTAEEAFDYAKANCDYDKPTIGDYFEDDLLL